MGGFNPFIFSSQSWELNNDQLEHIHSIVIPEKDANKSYLSQYFKVVFFLPCFYIFFWGCQIKQFIYRTLISLLNLHRLPLRQLRIQNKSFLEEDECGGTRMQLCFFRQNMKIVTSGCKIQHIHKTYTTNMGI